MKRLAILSLLFVVVGAAACGGDQLSKKDSKTAWAATNHSLTRGSSQAQTASAPADSLTTNFDYSCPGGGTATFAGTFDYATADPTGTGIGLGSTAIDSDFAVTYDNCMSEDVTIDGTIDYVVSVDLTDTSSSTDFTWKGQLDYSGEVEGNCVIDMTGSSSTSLTGGSVGLDVSYEGSICGHDATKTLS